MKEREDFRVLLGICMGRNRESFQKEGMYICKMKYALLSFAWKTHRRHVILL